jgi:hypothetical protein
VLQNRFLQLDKTRFRNTLAGCTVTICEHLDGSLSVRWGPHLLTTVKAERDGGKDSARGALEISPKSRDSHFAHRPTTATRTLKSTARRKAASPDRYRVNKTGQIQKLMTAELPIGSLTCQTFGRLCVTGVMMARNGLTGITNEKR